MLTITYYTLPETRSVLLFRRLSFRSYSGKEKFADEVCSPDFPWRQQEPALRPSEMQAISLEEGLYVSESWQRDRSTTRQAEEPYEVIARLKSKLERLASVDTSFQMHGARQHGYHLQPPLSPERISEIESEHGLSLPAEYRLFLQEVGRAGAGPDYGLFDIEQVLQRGLGRREPDSFQKPFRAPASSEEFEENEDTYTGLLAIGTQGCSYTTVLVLSGEERGAVWETSEWAIVPLGPSPPPAISALLDWREMDICVDYYLSPAYSHHFTFFEWYEDWLDRGLKRFQ